MAAPSALWLKVSVAALHLSTCAGIQLAASCLSGGSNSCSAASCLSASPTTVTDRRSALIGAATAAILPGLSPVVAQEDGSWSVHAGPFTDEFFSSFESGANGFKYKFIEEGEGEKPQPFQKVFVHYTGYLLDGTKFDSSYGKGDPFSFRLAKGKVIVGWEALVGGMKPGMKIIAYIPPEFAYGSSGINGVIPPNAPLIFYMELVKLGNIKGDKPRLGSTFGAGLQ